MGLRQLTTLGMLSPTQPHKWSWSATAGIIEMLLERCFKQHDTLPSLSMTKALHMLRAKPSFACHVCRSWLLLLLLLLHILCMLMDAIIIMAIKPSLLGSNSPLPLLLEYCRSKIPPSPHRCHHQKYKFVTLKSSAPSHFWAGLRHNLREWEIHRIKNTHT